MNSSLSIPNPALEPLKILVGEWKVIGSHPLMPGVEIHGQVSFEWIEGGAFLRMYSEMDDPRIPTGVEIFGSDNDSGTITMLHFDERKVSRRYECTIDGNTWKWWRNDPKFSQRFTVTIADDGATMESRGEMSREGGEWEPDLALTYSRV